ncbi:hypothetical protein [Benzoatithermus flavus]|uniref:Uncharacterized protein n=1 Tax=Benzoatithermus flavus TaxID=3108223 RepID=A0ABU8XPM3_9PROT
MGQIIEFEQWRRKKPQVAPAIPEPSGWPSLPAAYVDSVFLPTVAMWRSFVASCATWWLAPIGLEVRPVDPTPPAQDKERLSSTR